MFVPFSPLPEDQRTLTLLNVGEPQRTLCISVAGARRRKLQEWAEEA